MMFILPEAVSAKAAQQPIALAVLGSSVPAHALLLAVLCAAAGSSAAAASSISRPTGP